MSEPLLEVRDLAVRFPVSRGVLQRPEMLVALESVSFRLGAGEALGIVGESGCGKSTLVRALLRLVSSARGEIIWIGRHLEGLSGAELRPLRRDLQIVFQDPLASLDPRFTVAEIVGEPLRVHRPELGRAGRAREVAAMLEQVGLGAEARARYPHEFSGGQCQRIAIARALILRPRLLVCDEPVSALDVSIQAQIVNLIAELRARLGTAILFVSHNLAVVRRLCDRVLVLYLGRVLEIAPTAALFAAPLHPYTRALLEAVPVPDPELQPQRLRAVREGEPPSPTRAPGGCVFRTRCPRATPRCTAAMPALEAAAAGRLVACHRWREPG